MKSIVLIAAMLTGAAAFLPGAANAQVGFTLEVGTPPPPVLRYEVVPPPRYGYEWVQGYWDWNGRDYVWVPGYWIEAREGYYFDAPTWIIIDNRWHFNRGGWRPGPPPHRFDHDRYHGDHDRDDDHDRDHEHDRDHDHDHNGDHDRHGDRGKGWGYRAAPPRSYGNQDRDGDGIPNRYDRFPDNGSRR